MAELEQEDSSLKVRLAVYRKLVERYSDEINEGEQKTIPELKELVVAKDSAVQQVRSKILSELGFAQEEISHERTISSEPIGNHYRYEKDFLAAAEKAYNYCQNLSKLHHDFPVSFWLKPREIVELCAADAFDRAIFLCSLLRALGNDNCKVRVLDLEQGLKHPTVSFSYNEKQYLMDPMQECSAFTYHDTLDNILKNYTYQEKKCLKSSYEFNDKEYIEFE